MRYENPLPDEHVNYTKEHPLKEFSQLLIGIAVVVLLVTIVLNYSAGLIARQVPFTYEQELVGDFGLLDGTDPDRQKDLQALADRVSRHMDLPTDMQISVHYDEDDVVNAFATLGGHLVFFQGLLDQIESEQELSAVMAHEIAHIKHRHPIVALGKGVTLATMAAFVGGASGSGVGEWLIGSSANLSMLQFSREQEQEADASAARALYRMYGHIGGADELFKKFSKLEAENFDTTIGLELFRSHPYSKDRWTMLADIAKTNGWPTSGALDPRDYSKEQSKHDGED